MCTWTDSDGITHQSWCELAESLQLRPGASLILLRVGSEPSLELAHHRHQAGHFGDCIEQRSGGLAIVPKLEGGVNGAAL
jgi:hypothetical protein